MSVSFLQTWSATKRLTLFALVMLSLTTAVFLSLKTTINAQRQSALLTTFKAITPQVALDESLLQTAQTLALPSQSALYYHAPSGEHYVVASTMQGYSGEIRLMMALSADKTTVLGVRVLEHKETPGLGDKIEPRVSDWILSFNNTSLATKRFEVKKDGGDFDAFTGATITPRAIVREVGVILREFPHIVLPPPPPSALPPKEQP